jgi:polyphosphate:AMP phosphotransferase
MFEAAELGVKLDKDEYLKRVPGLRWELLQRQFELRTADFPVVVLLSGDDRPSCSDVLNLLHEWMDPRFVEGNAFGVPTDEENERPFFWRYWRRLPARGRIGIFVRAWTMQPIVMRMIGSFDEGEFEHWLAHVRGFERTLAADGALLLKFWFHLPPKEFRRRVKRGKKNSEKLWRSGKHDTRLYENYDLARELMEKSIRLTSTGEAPWHVVESTDERHRNMSVAEEILKTLTRRLEEEGEKTDRPVAPAEASSTEDVVTVLDKVDLTVSLPKSDYSEALDRWQSKLFRETSKALDRGVSTVLVFEGWDASGKGGIIRRLTHAMDASLYRVVPIAAPTEEELAHHYQWRFWRHLPRAGNVTIFDRSWYGRVLVERVEGLASEDEWRRAFSEINVFEEQLVEHGIVLLKFWLHVDADEQLRRFQLRERTPFKKFKITAEDYRNRERRNDYEVAANEMIARTSTEYARWNLIAANHKRRARIEVLETVCNALSQANKKAK